MRRVKIVINNVERFDKNWVLLDTCAEISIFRDKELFQYIEEAEPLVVEGVSAEDPGIIVTQQGPTEFGVCYYHPNTVANILSFGELVD